MLHRLPRAPFLSLALLAAGALPARATAPGAAFEGLLGCQALADAGSRLACYDRELARVAPLLRAPAGGGAAAAAGTAPASGSGAQASVSAQAASAEADFGRVRPRDDQVLKQISTTLPEGFSGWRAGDRIRLGNGQIWRIADDSNGVVFPKSRRVVIRQGALGAFYLEFDGDNRSPRVRRVD
jgi:hypothetical protein